MATAAELRAIQHQAQLIKRIPRREFIERYWTYRLGEHVTFLADTQLGKTELALSLLAATTAPQDAPQGLVFVMKPGDPTIGRWVPKLARIGYKRLDHWGPPLDSHERYPRRRRPSGWVLWPKLGNLRTDRHKLHDEFGHALADSYAAGRRKGGANRILVIDEILGFVSIGLGDDLNEIYERGSGMGLPIWGATQRPYGAPVHMYSAPRHVFIAVDNDRRNRTRFKEIGGVNSELIAYVVNPENDVMDMYEFLYINRNERSMCIIGA